MKACAFFGNRYSDYSVKEPLKEAITRLICDSYDIFYVGNHGNFDTLVLETLKENSL